MLVDESRAQTQYSSSIYEVPKNIMKDVTYGQFVCNERPKKAEKNRTQFTVRGDRINYPGAVSTPTAEILVT